MLLQLGNGFSWFRLFRDCCVSSTCTVHPNNCHFRRRGDDGSIVFGLALSWTWRSKAPIPWTLWPQFDVSVHSSPGLLSSNCLGPGINYLLFYVVIPPSLPLTLYSNDFSMWICPISFCVFLNKLTLYIRRDMLTSAGKMHIVRNTYCIVSIFPSSALFLGGSSPSNFCR